MVFHNDPLFFRSSVGFEDLVSRINKIHSAMTVQDNYPPYNLRKVGEDKFVIEVAVAGFEEKDITVQVKDGGLFIEGSKPDPEKDDGVEYFHTGIAGRKFKRVFSLADHVEVVSCSLKNGILSIAMEKKIPEALKPKVIPINS